MTTVTFDNRHQVDLRRFDPTKRPVAAPAYWARFINIPQSAVTGPNCEPFFSFRRLKQVDLEIMNWVAKAFFQRVPIDEPLNEIGRIINDMPELVHPERDFRTAIPLIYQNKMRRLYLCEIIRKYTRTLILRNYEQNLSIFSGNLEKLNKVEANKTKLLSLIPPEVDVLYMPHVYELILRTMNDDCGRILRKMDRMREDLLK